MKFTILRNSYVKDLRIYCYASDRFLADFDSVGASSTDVKAVSQPELHRHRREEMGEHRLVKLVALRVGPDMTCGHTRTHNSNTSTATIKAATVQVSRRQSAK